MRKFYLYILFLIISFSSYSQTATIPIVSNSNGVIDNTSSSNMFYGRDCNASCYGNSDAQNRNICTYEAVNLTLTSTIITELNNSTTYFTSGNGYTGNLLEYNGGLNVGDVVNVYMIYLNDNSNYRSTSAAPKFTFSEDIVAVGYDWNHSLWFTGSRFGTSSYPRYANASATGKFKDRRFEPSNGTGDSDYNGYNSGFNSTGSGDWFRVLTSSSSNNNRSPGYNGTLKTFQLGCKNGAKGDFFRIITKVSCSEPTGAGSIGNPQSNCGSFNPATITNTSSGSGGSGGTATYFWQKSTTSNSSNFSTISGATSTTYNPPSTISQTTWYRRGYYRCNSSAAVYTSAVAMTVNSNPTASASASPASICSGNSSTLSASFVSGATYAWRVSGSSTILSTSRTFSISPSTTTIYQITVTKNGCSATDNVTITVNPANSAGTASSSPTLCINTVLTNITHSTSAATGISNSGVTGANGLPAGVSASWSGDVITISGTPTAAGTFNYTIPLTGGCGSVNATGTITVTGDNTAGTASSTPTQCVNTALTNITIATTGATGISCLLYTSPSPRDRG